MRIFLWLVGLLLAFVAGAVAIVFSGAYNVAADEPHWALTKYAMEATRKSSVAARASDIPVPDLEDKSLVRAGAGNYDSMCTACHLKPGLESTEQSRGLYPVPPDLTRKRLDDPTAAFWTIKHGIKMTGMPAWGKSMEDSYIWGMVAFLRKLPDLTPEAYDALVQASGGHQHGGSETGGTEEDEAAGPTHDDDHSKAPPHQH